MITNIRDIEDGDLYALLSVCSNEDLEPLVKYITGAMTNSLEKSNDYKIYSPNHAKYNSRIGDEIRLFGGNSLLNVFRRGEGPSYDNIVVDVCKKLDIPFEEGKTVDNENNLLTIHFDRQWKALSQKQQEEIIADAGDTATNKLHNASSILRAMADPVWAIADPVSRVTVPCVLHISYLRKRFLEKEKKSSDFSTVSTRNPPITSSQNSDNSRALIIGESESKPVLSIAQIPAPLSSQNWRTVDATADGISRLNPLLQAVPSLATAIEVASTKYMEVVINGPLAMAADGNGCRGFARGGGINGQSITEHVRLFESSDLSNIVNPAALLQVASVALAQKHLADISKKLTEIKTGIDKIQKFQVQGRRSVISGAIRYFEQVALSVLAGEQSDGIRNQIEHHEANLLQVQDHIMEDIRDAIQQTTKIKGDDSFGSKEMSEAINSHQKLLDDLYAQLLLCIRARACGWQLLVAFPGEEHLKENRKHDIRDALTALDEGGDLLKQTDMLMRQKIHNLSAIWNKNTTLNERKLSLLKGNEGLVLNLKTGCEQLVQDLHTAETMMNEQQQPVTIIVKVENNQIIATCTL